MSKVRGIIYGAVIVCLLAYLWAQRHRTDRAVDAQIKAVTLPANDQVKVIIDSAHHSLTTVTRGADGRTKTQSQFFRDSASVELRKDGSVVVTAPRWGTEINPFMGIALGSDLMGRAALGLNGLYVQRWELGGGLLLSKDIHDTRVFAHVSYNPYKSIFVSGAIDNRKTVHLLAGVKF